jgi:hypothetical protein
MSCRTWEVRGIHREVLPEGLDPNGHLLAGILGSFLATWQKIRGRFSQWEFQALYMVGTSNLGS